MGYAIAVLVRLLWSLTIGLLFFLIGLVLFLILDIFLPSKDTGYRVLTKLFQWGSCYWFKGIKVQTDDYDIEVGKRRQSYVILDNGLTVLAETARKENKPVVADWERNMGRIRKSSGLTGKWVDDEARRMLRGDWETLVNVKLGRAGRLQDESGQKTSPAVLEQQEQKCIARIIAWQQSE